MRLISLLIGQMIVSYSHASIDGNKIDKDVLELYTLIHCPYEAMENTINQPTYMNQYYFSQELRDYILLDKVFQKISSTYNRYYFEYIDQRINKNHVKSQHADFMCDRIFSLQDMRIQILEKFFNDTNQNSDN